MLRPFQPRVLTLVLTIGVLAAACGGIGSETTVAPSTTAVPAATSTSAASTTSSTTTTTDPGFVQAEGEIFLEPAGAEGPDSFTGELFAEPATTTTSTVVAAPPPAPSGPTTVSAVVGDAPALYGGSRDRAMCDKEGQLRFLQQNPDKAAAFVAALNSDPGLRWSGGTSVTVAQLPDYWNELTPMILTRDTRVTNHGYRKGRPLRDRQCCRPEPRCSSTLTESLAYGASAGTRWLLRRLYRRRPSTPVRPGPTSARTRSSSSTKRR